MASRPGEWKDQGRAVEPMRMGAAWRVWTCVKSVLLYALHPTPYTTHPTPYTLHPTPYTLHPTPGRDEPPAGRGRNPPPSPPKKHFAHVVWV